jgi:hypothetical protein
MVDADVIPKRRWSTRMRNFRGTLLVTGPDEEEALELTGAGTFMFRAIDGRRSVRDIAALVAGEYGLEPAEAVTDLREFIGDLVDMRIVELLSANGAAPMTGDALRPEAEQR